MTYIPRSRYTEEQREIKRAKARVQYAKRQISAGFGYLPLRDLKDSQGFGMPAGVFKNERYITPENKRDLIAEGIEAVRAHQERVKLGTSKSIVPSIPYADSCPIAIPTDEEMERILNQGDSNAI